MRLVQSNYNNGADPASVVLPAAVTTGNPLFVVVCERSGGSASNHVISTITGWTHQIISTTQQGDSTYRRTHSVFWKIAQAGDGTTISVDDGTANSKRVLFQEFEFEEGETEFTFLASASNNNGTTANATSIASGTTSSVNGDGDKLFTFCALTKKNAASVGVLINATWTGDIYTDDRRGATGNGMSIFAGSGHTDITTSTKSSTVTISGNSADTDNNGLNASILVFSLGAPPPGNSAFKFRRNLTNRSNTRFNFSGFGRVNITACWEATYLQQDGYGLGLGIREDLEAAHVPTPYYQNLCYYPCDGTYVSSGQANVPTFGSGTVKYFEIARDGLDKISIDVADGTQASFIVEADKKYKHLVITDVIDVSGDDYARTRFWPDVANNPSWVIDDRVLLSAINASPADPGAYFGAADHRDPQHTALPASQNDETAYGYLRCFQLYDAALSEADGKLEAVNETTTPVTSAGQANVYYLKPNPTGWDISDDSSAGNDPVWPNKLRPLTVDAATDVEVDAGFESISLATFPSTIALSTTLTPALESILLTEFTAGIASDRAVSAALGPILIAPNAASLSLDRTILGFLESISLTPYQSSVSLSSVIAAALESIILAANPASISADTTVGSTLESILLTAYQASIVVGADINAALESIEVSPFAANVIANTTVGGSVELLSLTASPATVIADSEINSSLQTIAISPFVSNVITDKTIESTLESLTLTTTPATVVIGTVVSANLESMTLGTFAAAIAANTTITGALESIQVVSDPASVSLGNIISAGAESITLSAFQGSVALDVVISSALQNIILTELSAQVGIAKNIDAQLESITITPNGATIVLNNNISATLESLTLTALQASIVSPITEINGTGLGFTLPENKIEFSLPTNKLHFTFRR